MITGNQIRAARALLAWSQSDLAGRARVSLATIKRLEAKRDEPAGTVRTNESLRSALEASDIVFIDDDALGGRGVRIGGLRDRLQK